jgi:hypothetical protein
MTSLGVVAISDTGCALLLPAEKQPLEKIALRKPDQIGRLSENQLTQLWEIFDHIGTAWQSREFCTIQSRQQLEPILTLKTERSPSYLTEYREAAQLLEESRQRRDPQQALHHLYFEQSDEHLKRFVIAEFLRLHLAYGGFRFLPYRNALGFAGGSFNQDDTLPYRDLSHTC